MRIYSKLVSEWWNNLPEDVKIELQRKYQIKRDQKSKIAVNEEDKSSNLVITIPNNVVDSSKIKGDCYLTESISKGPLNNNDDIKEIINHLIDFYFF